ARLTTAGLRHRPGCGPTRSHSEQATATAVARKFSEYLGKVEHGQSLQIVKHGKIVARLVPDCGFMDGKPEEDEPPSLFPSPRSCVTGRGRWLRGRGTTSLKRGVNKT